MKKRSLGQINNWIYLVILVCTIGLLITISVCNSLEVYNPRGEKEGCREIEATYQMADDEDAYVKLVELYIFDLPDISDNTDALAFYTVHQEVNVYFDDELVYSLKASEDNPIGSTPASNCNFVNIRPEDSGKEVTIEAIPVYRQAIGNPVKIYVGDKKTIFEDYLRSNVLTAILSGIPLVVGAVFLCMSLFAVKDLTKKESTFMLGLFSVELGIWKLLDLTAAPLVFKHNPIAISYISIIQLTLMIFPFARFIKSIMNREYKVLDYLNLAINGVLVIIVGLQILGIADFRETLIFCHLSLGVAIVVIISILCVEGTKGKTETRLTVTVLGMALCALGLIYDLLQFYVIKTSSEVYTTLLCFDVYIIVMGIVLAYDSHKMIMEAKKRAEDANTAKSRFLSNMSHDIRTPMNAIVGFTGIAEAHMDDPERLKDALTKIRSSSEHLLKLINDVLDMSKIESGKIILDVQPVSISATIGNLVNIMSAQMQDKGIDFVTDVDNVEHDCVYCDALRANQVMLNLLGNAYKFTQPGGRVTFSLVEVPSFDPAQASFKVRVSDNGIGMSEEFKSHAFEAFIREHDSQGDNIQGTGLGLAICKNIVELAGGTIIVNSALGQGTEFIIDISFYIANPEDLPKPVEEDVNQIDFGGKRVLLVDDNQLNREVVVEILSTLDLIVDTAEDGDIAVEKVKNAPVGYYGAVLMDIQMPVMNGYDATRTIRDFDDPAKATIPIIAMTANAFEEDKLRAYEAGMNAHVAKPIDIDELLRVLSTFLT